MNKTEEKENYQTNLGFVTIAPLDENSTVGKVSTPKFSLTSLFRSQMNRITLNDAQSNLTGPNELLLGLRAARLIKRRRCP